MTKEYRIYLHVKATSEQRTEEQLDEFIKKYFIPGRVATNNIEVVMLNSKITSGELYTEEERNQAGETGYKEGYEEGEKLNITD